jgi:ABC-type molybdate transport system substrate-binding protein
VLAAVRSGQAEAGLVYYSDGAAAEGCRVLFRARPATVRYTAALTRRGAGKPAARMLVTFLTSPAAERRLRQWGFLPGSGDG